jgi:hypothetical protein
MVWHDDARGAVVNRAQCVIGTQDALHEDRQLRHSRKPLDVFPGQCCIKEGGDVSGKSTVGNVFRKLLAPSPQKVF